MKFFFTLALFILFGHVNAAEKPKVQIKTMEKESYGQYLTDADGRALYLFTSDTPRLSTCYDSCAVNWPPMLTPDIENIELPEGMDRSLLSSLKRKDGTTQVVYGGWPLYTFAKDKQPGDILGQDKQAFGAEWHLISPQGQKVDEQ